MAKAEPELITLAEAGRRLGLANLADYKRKYDTFPQPIRRIGRMRLWGWEQIEEWYATEIDHEHPWAHARDDDTKESNA